MNIINFNSLFDCGYINDYGIPIMMEYTDCEVFNCKKIKHHRKLLGITQDELAKWMGLGRTTIIKYEKGDVIPSDSLKKLNLFFEIRNKAELFDYQYDKCGMEYKAVSTGEYLMRIPYIPTSFYEHYINNSDTGNLRVNHFIHMIDSGIYIAFEVKGEAMDDGSRVSLKMGDIVITQEMDKDNLKVEKDDSNVWAILVGKEILFRKAERFIDEDKILFKALNPSLEYSDFTLKISDIKKIYKVIQRRTNF